jgi:EAL and modified HD-GYP domain-containing signal transduction protein
MDVKQQIIGYELFLNHIGDSVPQAGDFKAYASMLMSSTDGMDLNWLLGNKLVFLRVSASMLHSELLELMPPQTTVLIIQTVLPSDDFIARCQQLRTLGFRLALDNPQLSPQSQSLLSSADYIVIDMQALEVGSVEKSLAAMHLPQLTILVQNIATKQEFAACQQAGFMFLLDIILRKAKPTVQS